MLSSAIAAPMILLASTTGQLEDLPALDKRIQSVVQPRGLSPRPIDKRIKLARCPTPAVIERQSSSSLAVRCPQIGWRIRVPLTSPSPNTIDARNNGNVSVISVERGEAVELRVGGSGFYVTTNAVAVEKGSLGDTIRVKSQTSRNPLVARIVGKGIVEIR